MPDQTPATLPTADARAALDALLGKQVRTTTVCAGTVHVYEGELIHDALYAVRGATIRYPGADVHVDQFNLVAVEELTQEPVTARWEQITTRDADGTVWVLCTTEDEKPVALALDEEHAEALAGSLLDTEDGEEVMAPTSYRAGVRDALAAAAREVERTGDTASPAALASAIRMMGTAGPLAQDGPVQAHAEPAVLICSDDRHQARIRELEEQLAAAILFRVGDVRISRAKGRWEVGISHTSPRWTPGTEPEELHDRDRAFIRAHQLADGAPAPAPADPRSREQLAAATWPSRAARQLDADAHPTTERTSQ